jgi:hypothetical protein
MLWYACAPQSFRLSSARQLFLVALIVRQSIGRHTLMFSLAILAARLVRTDATGDHATTALTESDRMLDQVKSSLA